LIVATVRPAGEIRSVRERGAGFRNTISRILAGPAQGCSGALVRYLTVKKGGRMPRKECQRKRICTVIQGELVFMDGDGAVSLVREGDVVIVPARERHHFQNDAASPARIHIVELAEG